MEIFPILGATKSGLIQDLKSCPGIMLKQDLPPKRQLVRFLQVRPKRCVLSKNVFNKKVAPDLLL